LRPVLADLFKERAVGAEIEDGVSRTAVDMPPPEEIGDHEKIIGLPLEPPAGEFGRAFAIEHNVEGVRGFALPAGRLARSWQLRAVIQRREHRRACRRGYEARRTD